MIAIKESPCFKLH